MIPKIIHLCWLSGDPYPDNIKMCVNSIYEKLSDYEIRIWSKDTFDIDSVKWVKEAYEAKKFAFAADYIRFWSLYNFGGIYLDSDVQVIKSYNNLLNNKCFLGFEFLNIPEAATIGAEPGMKWVERCLDYYKDRSFIDENGNMRNSPVPYLVRLVLNNLYKVECVDNGRVQNLGDIRLYPYTYFSPKNYYSEEVKLFEETYSIHRFASAWGPKAKMKWVMYLHRILLAVLGKELHDKLYRIYAGYPDNFNEVKYSDF